jgi:ABC-type Fe3+ transport system substrate-binding protein
MTSTLHLALPPNIARQVLSEIQTAFPGAALHPPQNHDEMADFFQNRFGEPEKTADLTLTAYPSALARAVRYEHVFATMPPDLPVMRRELMDTGLKEPFPFVRVAAAVTLMIIYHKSVDPSPEGWADLCREDLAGDVVIPPHNTPAPALYAHYLEKLVGEIGKKAAARAHAKLFPQDINKYVDAGVYKAGMVFPAFARTFRLGMAGAVWPKEGAVVIPLLAFLKKGAGKDAVRALHALFSRKNQTIIAENGLFCPVLEKVPLFSEMQHNNSRLLWSGWDDYMALGDGASFAPPGAREHADPNCSACSCCGEDTKHTEENRLAGEQAQCG